MTHGAEHHIEHAEHAVHNAGDAFNRHVTMSIAIVAAVLACVTMLGHRAHNDTLRLQGEALELQTKASIKSTETANKWAYYQGKNTFNLLSEIMLDSLSVMTVRDDRKEQLKDVLKRYEDTVEYYSGDKDNRVTRKKKKDEKDKKDEKVKKKPDHDAHATSTGEEDEENEAKKKDDGHDGDKKKGDGRANDGKKKGDEVKKTEGKLKHMEDEAREYSKQSDELMKESKHKVEESHEMHHRTTRFDLGELFLQFGVVLCSLAILTKGRSLWLMGIVSAIIGALIAASGQFNWFLGGGGH